MSQSKGELTSRRSPGNYLSVSTDLRKMCRVCLLAQTTLKSLLEDDIKNRFEDITQVKLKLKEPTQICDRCETDFESTYDFVIASRKSDTSLRKLNSSTSTTNKIKVCRVCLNQTSGLQSMFTNELSEPFVQTTAIQINKSDDVKNYICGSCILQLHLASSFLDKYRKATKSISFIVKSHDSQNALSTGLATTKQLKVLLTKTDITQNDTTNLNVSRNSKIKQQSKSSASKLRKSIKIKPKNSTSYLKKIGKNHTSAKNRSLEVIFVDDSKESYNIGGSDDDDASSNNDLLGKYNEKTTVKQCRTSTETKVNKIKKTGNVHATKKKSHCVTTASKRKHIVENTDDENPSCKSSKSSISTESSRSEEKYWSNSIEGDMEMQRDYLKLAVSLQPKTVPASNNDVNNDSTVPDNAKTPSTMNLRRTLRKPKPVSKTMYNIELAKKAMPKKRIQRLEKKTSNKRSVRSANKSEKTITFKPVNVDQLNLESDDADSNEIELVYIDETIDLDAFEDDAFQLPSISKHTVKVSSNRIAVETAKTSPQATQECVPFETSTPIRSIEDSKRGSKQLQDVDNESISKQLRTEKISSTKCGVSTKRQRSLIEENSGKFDDSVLQINYSIDREKFKETVKKLYQDNTAEYEALNLDAPLSTANANSTCNTCDIIYDINATHLEELLDSNYVNVDSNDFVTKLLTIRTGNSDNNTNTKTTAASSVDIMEKFMLLKTRNYSTKERAKIMKYLNGNQVKAYDSIANSSSSSNKKNHANKKKLSALSSVEDSNTSSTGSNNSNEFVCELCTEAFRNVAALLEHLNVHTSTNDNRANTCRKLCSMCSTMFPLNYSLDAKKLKCEKRVYCVGSDCVGKGFACQVCGKELRIGYRMQVLYIQSTETCESSDTNNAIEEKKTEKIPPINSLQLSNESIAEEKLLSVNKEPTMGRTYKKSNGSSTSNSFNGVRELISVLEGTDSTEQDTNDEDSKHATIVVANTQKDEKPQEDEENEVDKISSVLLKERERSPSPYRASIDLTIESDAKQKEKVTLTPVMNLQFNDLNDLKNELNTEKETKKRQHICTLCKQQLYSGHNLVRHMTLYHGINNEEKLKEHLNSSDHEVDSDSVFPIRSGNLCDLCGQVFNTKIILKNHRKKCETLLSGLNTPVQSSPFLCDICGKVFPWFATYYKHSVKCSKTHPYHGTDRRLIYLCEYCGKVFTKSKNFHQHKQNHIIGTFKCRDCDAVFDRRTSLATHFKTAHRGVKYQCKYCPKMLSGPTSLKAHEFTHEPESGFLCSFCGKRFLTNQLLDAHLKLHYGFRPFSCKECGKGFTTKPNLNLHILTHTGVRRYECKTCGKRFVQTAHLKAHENVHKVDKKFSCEICGKGFVCEKYLMFHKRIHSKVPLKCPKCGKVFYTDRNYKKHMKTCEPGAILTASSAAATAVHVKTEDLSSLEVLDMDEYAVEDYELDGEFLDESEVQVAYVEGDDIVDGMIVDAETFRRHFLSKGNVQEFYVDANAMEENASEEEA